MKKHHAALATALAENQLVVLYRKAIDENRLDGYVVALSDTWVLLQPVDGNRLVLDGYKAVRLSDISHWKIDESFVDEYLRLRGIRSKNLPEIDVRGLGSLLDFVSKNFPLFMIECERIEPGIGFIGVIEKLTKRNLWLKKFSSEAKWIDTEKFKLKDITIVNFGDGYVEALAWMDAHDTEREARKNLSANSSPL